MGNALGELQNSASFGIISGLHRNIIAGDQMGGNTEQLQQVFQTDAAINPGNSGGPLIDLNGQVIGMNTAAAAQGQNIGFAIPINTVKPILAQFMK
jgi:S1-C subfamily serine protease